MSQFAFIIKRTINIESTDCRTGTVTSYQYINQALQAAIDALNNPSTGSTGGVILIHQGVYDLTDSIKLRSDIRIVGEINNSGDPTTVINIVAPLGNVIRNWENWTPFPPGMDVTGRRENITLENLRVEANERATYVVSLSRPINALVRNVKILHPKDPSPSGITGQTAFGHDGGTNVLYENCEAVASSDNSGIALQPGHGFALGGMGSGVQDVGTTLLNCRASGFNHPNGGQGLQIRSNQWFRGKPGYDFPLLPNKNLRILGGNYSNNLVGIWIDDASNPMVVDVATVNNNHFGLYISQGTLPREEVQVSINGGLFHGNGNNSNDNPAFGPAGGIRIIGQNSILSNVEMDGNQPNNLILDGVYFYIANCKFLCRRKVVPYHLYLYDYNGAPLTGWLIRNQFAPALFSRFFGRSDWLINWAPIEVP